MSETRRKNGSESSYQISLYTRDGKAIAKAQIKTKIQRHGTRHIR